MINIDQDILDIIEQGRTRGNLYFLPDQQLDRKTYLRVNKVLECLGGKWNRKSKTHMFDSDISDAIDSVLLTGEVLEKKKELQFFETPQNIVDLVVELAEVRSGHVCLEPSAGHGNIAGALRDIAGKTDMFNVFCVEVDPGNVETLVSKGFWVHEGDFLQHKVTRKYDRIVMNPPFTKQQDITHVLQALKHLGAAGILVSVMSAGITFRKNKKTLDFWGKVMECDYEIIQLPRGSFKVSGTMVNAVILKISNR